MCCPLSVSDTVKSILSHHNFVSGLDPVNYALFSVCAV